MRVEAGWIYKSSMATLLLQPSIKKATYVLHTAYTSSAISKWWVIDNDSNWIYPHDAGSKNNSTIASINESTSLTG